MKLQDLKLDFPTDIHTIAQGFGENANGSYASDGLLGHPAIDFNSPYNAPIYSASKGLGKVYKIFNKDNPDLMKYRAPCELIELEDCVIEITYGHCNRIMCPLGTVGVLEDIATVGNTGVVYQGSHLVTEQEKEAGSTAGQHLHFQLRKCQKVLKSEHDDKFLQDADGSLYREGDYFFVYKENGYAGCIDPAPYLPMEKHVFNLDMKLGDRNNEVSELQKFLKDKGYFSIEPTGYYGDITAGAVFKFQLDHVQLSFYEKWFLKGIRVGPKTRAVLNSF